MAARGGSGDASLSQLQRTAIRGVLRDMDPGLQKKLQFAFNAASSVAQERGLSFDETLQFIADFLIRHHDPDVRAFQQQRNNQHRRDVN